jgi:hypothetical protein
VIVRIQPWLSSAVLFFVIFLPSVMKAQVSIPPPDSGRDPISQAPLDSEEIRKWKKDAAKKANKERQAEIQRDTEKLLKLATELKDYVGKTDEHILSLDVIKKAEEIEKLAHDVKEKMKTSY